MSDRQLTVAELLARAGKTEGTKDAPRRRRRSLEEGGISVAELTGSIPRVKEKPQEARHSSSPIDGPDEQKAEGSTPPAVAESPPQSQAEATKEKEATEVQDSRKAEASSEVAEEKAHSPVESTVAEASEAQEPAEKVNTDTVVDTAQPDSDDVPAEEKTGVIPTVAEPVAEKTESEPEYAFFDENGEQVSHLPAHKDDEVDSVDEEEEGQGSWLATVGLAVVGIVLGIVVFLGFQRLWNSSLNHILVAVMAVAVTAVMVAIVHALRTARDGLSMALAAIVGLLMTFGPLLITLF
ncbi:hypothetical protein GP475_01870 [Corynebacterium poyangense]|uniref:Uncharacterized protein n=1 Tax=Corynebacterium poyangense TaxID=2684405 RepID=A0A7H0SLU2_9CORY|nr:hypothetical protein [Corynebacterium poyangense]MBZ8177624.1 hypothetical protein [Corynebacterium poyangense]QNQ89517.1 hypothetical protein GP475_01870 [Corynebacterium poyangense]